jgi:hypothetical protein
MKRKLPCLLMLPLIILTSCGQSPDEQLQTAIKTASSWTATAQMAAEAWGRGAVPHAYARRTLETAQENLQEAADALKEAEEIPAARKAQAWEQIGNLQQTVAQLRAAVENGDKASLVKNLDQLIKQKQALEVLTKSAGQ